VVQIFDFAKHEDTYYLAMEYVRGCTLWDLRKKCKELMEPVPPVLVAHIGAEVARGLHYAHRLKVNGEPLFLVHRDVTPHNVLISFDGAVKLTDFGIAKAGNKLTSPGMLKGKFAYMSPEQSRGENVDVRTDVFALGIVIWEMLTGGRLFDGDSELGVLRAVQQSVIPHPGRLNPDVPEELAAVVMKALQRDPEARHQTAGELERALVQCVLNHARSPDDTDVASFVRRVYIGGVASAQALPAVPERTQQLEGPPESAQVPREPTAAQPGTQGRKGAAAGGGEGSRPDPSPDEDVHAPTHLLPLGEASSGGKALPAGSSDAPSALAARPTAAVNATAEPPRYEAAMSLPAPGSQVTPRAAPASSGRLGLWAGLGLLALVAVVGIGSLLRSRTQGGAPIPAVSQDTGPVASPPLAGGEDAGPALGVAPPVEPTPSPEPMQVAQDSADAGTAPDAGALAVAPPQGSRPASSGDKAAAAEPRELEQGSLVLSAQPYAIVFVNRRKLGEVQGRKIFKLDPGNYRLTFQHPQSTKAEIITIEPGGRVEREFRATRGP
jgi:serine/threonine-protein kinase